MTIRYHGFHDRFIILQMRWSLVFLTRARGNYISRYTVDSAVFIICAFFCQFARQRCQLYAHGKLLLAKAENKVKKLKQIMLTSMLTLTWFYRMYSWQALGCTGRPPPPGLGPRCPGWSCSQASPPLSWSRESGVAPPPDTSQASPLREHSPLNTGRLSHRLLSHCNALSLSSAPEIWTNIYP